MYSDHNSSFIFFFKYELNYTHIFDEKKKNQIGLKLFQYQIFLK